MRVIDNEREAVHECELESLCVRMCKNTPSKEKLSVAHNYSQV